MFVWEARQARAAGATCVGHTDSVPGVALRRRRHDPVHRLVWTGRSSSGISPGTGASSRCRSETAVRLRCRRRRGKSVRRDGRVLRHRSYESAIRYSCRHRVRMYARMRSPPIQFALTVTSSGAPTAAAGDDDPMGLVQVWDAQIGQRRDRAAGSHTRGPMASISTTPPTANTSLWRRASKTTKHRDTRRGHGIHVRRRHLEPVGAPSRSRTSGVPLRCRLDLTTVSWWWPTVSRQLSGRLRRARSHRRTSDP